MLISGKGKYFYVFGCFSKNFPENIFWCLEKKKEKTNPRKISSTIVIRDRDLAGTISRSTARARDGAISVEGEIAINCAISQRWDCDRRFARSRRRAWSRSKARSRSIARSRDGAISRRRDRDRRVARSRRWSRSSQRSSDWRSAPPGARSPPAIVGLTVRFLPLSRAHSLSLFPEMLWSENEGRKLFPGQRWKYWSTGSHFPENIIFHDSQTCGKWWKWFPEIIFTQNKRTLSEGSMQSTP